jgi:hypothetical protein
MRITIAGLAVAALAGACAVQIQEQQPLDQPQFSDRRSLGEADNVFPARYKAETIAFLRSYLNDPSQIRDAFISQPVIRPVADVGPRYVACVRFNARRSDGSYAGSRDHSIVFFGGKLDRLAPTRLDCRDAAYQPFPELERLTR